MRYTLASWSSLALLAPLVAGCAAQATVTPPVVSANVDANAQVAGTADATGTVVAAGAPTDDYTDTDPSALTDFHQTLDSHGTWVDDPTYGTVWVPASTEVGPTYTPYSTSGHWAYDANDDYVWVSDYDWGWAPFHYGRWVEIDGRGWSWIPGRVYRGAWVNWGADDGYGTVGWAPMAPEFVWRGGVAVNYTYSGTPRWNYVGRGDVFATNVGARVYTGTAAANAAGHVHVTAGGGVSGHSGGPSPQNLGMSTSQVPHVTAASSAGIMKAQNFGHASTAASLGGHPPAHVNTGATSVAAGQTPTTGRNFPTQGHTTGVPTTTTTTTSTTTTRNLPKETEVTQGAHPMGTTTATTTTATTREQVQPQLNKTPPKKKLPTDTPTPTPTKATGAGTGGHTGTGGGHGGTTKQK